MWAMKTYMTSTEWGLGEISRETELLCQVNSLVLRQTALCWAVPLSSSACLAIVAGGIFPPQHVSLAHRTYFCNSW